MAERWFNILDNTVGDPKETLKRGKPQRLGCMGCPLDGTGRKLKGLKRIQQRPAMIWGLHPSKVDIDAGSEFHAGWAEFLWSELREVGLTRKMFDIQNIVRCRASEFGRDREPTVVEMKHCSVYNGEALERNGKAAKLHLIFGKIAAQQLLGAEYSATSPVIWSRKWNARVLFLEHPTYFWRGNAPPWKLSNFRLRLKAAKFFYNNPGQFTYFTKRCDFKVVGPRRGDVDEYFNYLEQAPAHKQRVALDIETGLIAGERKVLMIAGSWEKNVSRCLPIDHKEANPKIRTYSVDRLRAFLGDPKIKKVFQYGCSDRDGLWRLLRIAVRGFNFDTMYAHYFVYSFLKKHGLDSIASEGYPLYGDYKGMVDHSKLADLPLDEVALYNNADAALTKLIELDYAPLFPANLMQTYVPASQQFYDMQKRGPLLDREYLVFAKLMIRPFLKKLTRELRVLAGNPHFNPGANEQVAHLLYKKFKFKLPSGEKEGSTGIETLTALAEASGHPFPMMIAQFRRFAKMDSTYLQNYENSADIHNGELHTKWNLTGTATGRASSGGGKDPGIINMQNLHGDLMLKNLMVSDVKWKEVLERVTE